MDIRKTLLEEKVQSKELALSIADYAVKSKKNFHELMQCFVDSEYRLAQRAAWCVSWAARKKPSMNTALYKTFGRSIGEKRRARRCYT